MIDLELQKKLKSKEESHDQEVQVFKDEIAKLEKEVNAKELELEDKHRKLRKSELDLEAERRRLELQMELERKKLLEERRKVQVVNWEIFDHH